MNVASWIRQHAMQSPSAITLIADDGHCTNEQLYGRAAFVAEELTRQGLSEGQVVGLVLETSADLFAAATGVWLAGGVVAVLPTTPAEEVRALLRHCGAKFAIATPDSKTAEANATWKCIQLPSKESCTRDDWARAGRIALLAEPVSKHSSDIAQLSYTSGATGRAKAVVYTHGTLNAFCEASRAVGMERRTVLLAVPPTAFASRFLLVRALGETTYVLLDRFRPDRVLDSIEKHRVTMLPIVPTMAEQLLADRRSLSADCSSLRTIAVGGAHVSRQLVSRLKERFGRFGTQTLVQYGMTEAGGGIAASASSDGGGFVGRPLEGVDVEIRSEDGSRQSTGGIGEIVVRSPFSGSAYWRDDESTARVFRDDRVHTGDLGFVDADGNLCIVGRRKELIIQGGHNIHPEEVADVIQQVPGVRECAVIGVPNELLGEEAVACVVKAPAADIDERAVLQYCRSVLDPRKIPVCVLLVAEMPRTHLGKTDLVALRELALRQLTGTSAAASRSSAPSPSSLTSEIRACLLQVLAEADERVVDLPPGSEASSFFELGLDSIGAVRFARLLGGKLDREIPPAQLYATSTTSSLAEWLSGAERNSAPPPDAIRKAPASDDQIVVVGMACRLPGGVRSPNELWRLLSDAKDATAADAPPLRRGSVPRPAAYLDDIEMFDAPFFRLASECHDIDPRHRILLEVVWEAIDDAGCHPLEKQAPHTGLMLGISGERYRSRMAIGQAPGMAVGGVCHFFDFQGPAFAIDTTCSSSLVALHHAITALRAGECDYAIAAGVNMIDVNTPPVPSIMAADGRSKAFDAAADGFGQGEGCIAIVLRRRADAERDRNRCYATILGSAIGHDGRSSSMTAPHPAAQVAVIRKAQQIAGIEPDRVQYVEAHGTGTLLGDPIEVAALSEAFTPRSGEKVRVGSVKTNIGHLEAAAGLAGIVKVILAIRNKHIPASLHLQAPNPHVDWETAPVHVQHETGPWPTPNAPLIAGVSSFGMSGTNAHVIVAEPPPEVDTASSRSERGSLAVLPISAATRAGLLAAARSYADFLSADSAESSHLDIAYTASCRRRHFPFRIAVTGTSKAELAEELERSLAAGLRRDEPSVDTPVVTMVFNGQGSQHAGMGCELLRAEPVFRQALEACALEIGKHATWDLLEELGKPGAESRLSETAITQPAIFAVQVALYRLWDSWGITPLHIVGHSVGEIAAAHASGALTLEQAARLVCERGSAVQEFGGRGGMISVALPAVRLRRVIDKYGVEIAADNGPRSTVLSGDAQRIEAAARLLREQGIESTPLRVTYAFHSALMEQAASAVENSIDEWYEPRSAGSLVSTLTGLPHPRLDASYWGKQLRERVRFRDAVSHALDRGSRIFLEVGPSTVLAGLTAAIVSDKEQNDRIVSITSIRRPEAEHRSVLRALAELYEAGYPVTWDRRDSGAAKLVSLPRYPWQHRPYWRHQDISTASGSEGPSVGTGTSSRDSQPIPPPTSPEWREDRAETTEELRAWLQAELTALTGVPDLPSDCTLRSLGIDSLARMRIRARIEQHRGTTLGEAQVAPTSTVEDLLALIAAGSPAKSADESPFHELVWLRGRAHRSSCIWIHPIGGGVSCYEAVGRCSALPAAAIAMVRPTTDDDAASSIPELASRYLSMLDDEGMMPPHGLAGWSFGGLIAYEMAVQLARRGAPAPLLVLIDTYAPMTADDDNRFSLQPPHKAGSDMLYAFLRELCLFPADQAMLESIAAISSRHGVDDYEGICASIAECPPLATAFPKETRDRLQILSQNFRLSRDYLLPHYAGPVLYYRAARTPVRHVREFAACAPRMQVHEANEDHYSIVSERSFSTLVAGLAGYRSAVTEEYFREPLGSS